MTIHVSTWHNVYRTLAFWRIDSSPDHIKFAKELIPLIKSGQKTITYRLNGKFSNVKAGDRLYYGEKDGAIIGIIIITEVEHKKFKDIPTQIIGHEPYKDKKEQIEVFSKYYNRTPNPDEIVDVLHFTLE